MKKSRCDRIVLRDTRILSDEDAYEKAVHLDVLQKEVGALIESIDKEVDMHDCRIWQRDDGKIIFFLDMPVFYENLLNANIAFYLEQDDYFGAKLGVHTRFEIEINYFSDLETLEEHDERNQDEQEKVLSASAYYYFDGEGKSGKLVTLAKSKTKRESLTDETQIPLYCSQMTAEDLFYVERVLNVMRHRLKDFIRVMKV